MVKLQRPDFRDLRHPHLECPNCGEFVMSMKDRAYRMRPHVFTCPHCQCRYRIPGAVQNAQIGVFVAWILPLVMIYEKCIRAEMQSVISVWITSGQDTVFSIVDVLIYAVILIAGIRLVGFVGKRYAYEYPLEKAD